MRQRGQYVDWIITNNNDFFIGHGHAFLSGHSDTIKNAGTAIIKEGKIVSIVVDIIYPELNTWILQLLILRKLILWLTTIDCLNGNQK